MSTSEWHLTSKFFNASKFFDTADVDDNLLTELKLRIAFRKAAAKIRAAHKATFNEEFILPGGELWHKWNMPTTDPCMCLRAICQLAGLSPHFEATAGWGVKPETEMRLVIRAARNLKRGRQVVTLRQRSLH